MKTIGRQLGLLFLLLVPFAAGAQLLPFGRTVQSVNIQPLKERNDREKLWNAIQTHAKPIELAVLPNQSVEDAVRARCGNSATDLIDVLKSMNRPEDLAPAEINRVLKFIPCPYWYFGEDGALPSATIRAGDDVRKTVEKYLGANGQKTIEEVMRLNPDIVSKEGLAKASGKLKLPYLARPLSFELPLIASNEKFRFGSANAIISALPERSRVFAVSAGVGISDANYQLVEQVELDEEAAQQECGWPGGDDAWPVDTQSVGATIDEARQALKYKPNYGIVLVADTGLKFDKLTEPWRWENLRPLDIFPDANNYSDDKYGASMVTRSGADIQPEQGYKYAAHGTNVFRIISETGSRMHLKDTIRSIATAKLNNPNPPYDIASDSVTSAFYYGEHIGADALNLSVVIGTAPDGLIKVLTDPKLVVVSAAGNNGDWLDQLALYPPSLNRAREGLIVVGAHDWKGRIASFSNKGSLVDILAPGCAIPLKQENGSTVYLSGTSFAAPFVSTTVSMLLAVGMPKEPWRIRNRIIATGRFSNEIRKVTKYGVILDMERAVRVKEDSVLLKGATTPLYGKIVATQNWTCDVGGVSRNFLPISVAKVIQGLSISGRESTAVWTPGNRGSLIEYFCDTGFESPTFAFKRNGSESSELIRWDDIADLVTKSSKQ
jgi:hypothetical protein